MPTIDCVVLNFRTAELSLQAAGAARAALARYPGSRIHIVDNDSQDGSLERLQAAVAEAAWKDVRVSSSGRNGGYGAGNNFAIRQALKDPNPPDYIYILNPDATPAEDAVAALVDLLERTPDAGAAGSQLRGPGGEPHFTAFRFPSVESELIGGLNIGVLRKLLPEREISILPRPELTQEVDWTAGASLLLRRSVLEEVGLFDETFFLYFEETDLCRRIRAAGYRIFYVVESQVTHIGSVSTGYKEQDKPMPRFWFESRRHYFVKNHGRAYAWAANVTHAVGLATYQALSRARGRDPGGRKNFLRDFVRYNFLDERP